MTSSVLQKNCGFRLGFLHYVLFIMCAFQFSELDQLIVSQTDSERSAEIQHEEKYFDS